MTIQYRGKNVNEGRNNREAYIAYDEMKEQDMADKVFDYLRGNGWEVNEEEGCATIPLVHKDEYETLFRVYRWAKKTYRR